MTEKYTLLNKPIYFYESLDDNYNVESIGEDFDKEWVFNLYASLDKSCDKLLSLIKNSSLSFLDIRIKKDDKWYDLNSFLSLQFEGIENIMISSLRKYIECCIEGSKLRNETIWSSSESNMGQCEICWLACRDVNDVYLFIRYLECCDLGHEVDHMGDITDILTAHDWTNETVALWAARIGHCRGQWGHDGWDISPFLYDWVLKDKENEKNIIAIIASNLLLSIDTQEMAYTSEQARQIIKVSAQDFLKQSNGLGPLSESITSQAVTQATAFLEKDKSVKEHWLERAKIILSKQN